MGTPSIILLADYDTFREYGTINLGSNSGFVGYMTDLGGAGSRTVLSNSRISTFLQRMCSITAGTTGNDLQLWYNNGSVVQPSDIMGINVWDQSNTKRTFLVINTILGGGSWQWGNGTTPVWSTSSPPTITRRYEIF